MERINNLTEYKELIRWNKGRLGSVNTNCFLMAGNMQKYIDEARLYVNKYEDGVTVLLDEGRYYTMYYFWKPDAPFEDFRAEKPVLIEELDSKGSREGYIAAVEPALYAAGFKRFRNNLQVEADFKDSANTVRDEYDRRLACLNEQNLTLEACGDSDTQKQAIALWETYLDASDIPEDHLTLKDGDTLMNVLDANRNVVATIWWRVNGKTSECRHTVTRPDHYRKGLATMLNYAWIKQSIEAGAVKWMTWISDKNYRSLATYGKIGFVENGKTSKQYILEPERILSE